MFTARSARPSAISRAAATEPPAISADASCMPKKIGLSAVPSPWPTPNGASGADFTAVWKPGVCTRVRSTSPAGSGTTGSTPSSTPSPRDSSIISSSRTGLRGWSSDSW